MLTLVYLQLTLGTAEGAEQIHLHLGLAAQGLFQLGLRVPAQLGGQGHASFLSIQKPTHLNARQKYFRKLFRFRRGTVPVFEYRETRTESPSTRYLFNFTLRLRTDRGWDSAVTLMLQRFLVL